MMIDIIHQRRQGCLRIGHENQFVKRIVLITQQGAASVFHMPGIIEIDLSAIRVEHKTIVIGMKDDFSKQHILDYNG